MSGMNSDLRDRPVFICGHPKAGTSLVRAILDSHPQLIVYPEETIFFRRFLPQSVGLDLQGQLELAEKTLIHIFNWSQENQHSSQEGFPDRDYSQISYEAVRQAMRERSSEAYRHPGDILSAAVLAFGQVSGQIEPEIQRWVEKSPYNEYSAEQIFTWWPEARCIHVVRDPRDNYASYRRKHPSWNAEFFAANWRRSTRAGLQNARRFGPQYYHLLRYEDLTGIPEIGLRQLVDFLHIDWHPSLASPTRAGEVWAGNSMFSDRFQGISATPVERWKDELQAQEARVIELMDKSTLLSCNYSLSCPSIGQSLAARWRVATWPIWRRFHRSENIAR
jgi:hypothetical protein